MSFIRAAVVGILLGLCFFKVIPRDRTARAAEPSGTLQFVPELEKREDLKLLDESRQPWSSDDETRFAAAIASARDVWKREAAKFQKEVTVEKVRSLSRWAKPQMQEYKAVPALEKTKISPLGLTADKKTILFEGTIDTLPSHSPLVTRWLKVYFMYDIATRSIRHATITIRGQVLE